MNTNHLAPKAEEIFKPSSSVAPPHFLHHAPWLLFSFSARLGLARLREDTAFLSCALGIGAFPSFTTNQPVGPGFVLRIQSFPGARARARSRGHAHEQISSRGRKWGAAAQRWGVPCACCRVGELQKWRPPGVPWFSWQCCCCWFAGLPGPTGGGVTCASSRTRTGRSCWKESGW